MRRILACVAFLLAVGLASSSLAAAPSDLKALMDSTGLDYIHDKEGRFVLLIVEKTDSGIDSTIIVLSEVAADNAGAKSDFKVVYIYSLVVRVPEGCKYAHAFLAKIASLNDDLLIGKVSTNRDVGILYNSAFSLRTADVAELMCEIDIAYTFRRQLRKELKPFVDEACR